MEVRLNKEIRDYEEQLLLGFTLKQLIAVAIAILLSVGSYMLLKDAIGKSISSWISMLLAAVPVTAGFLEMDGAKGAEVFILLLRNMLLSHRDIAYEDITIVEKMIKVNER